MFKYYNGSMKKYNLTYKIDGVEHTETVNKSNVLKSMMKIEKDHRKTLKKNEYLFPFVDFNIEEI